MDGDSSIDPCHSFPDHNTDLLHSVDIFNTAVARIGSLKDGAGSGFVMTTRGLLFMTALALLPLSDVYLSAGTAFFVPSEILILILFALTAVHALLNKRLHIPASPAYFTICGFGLIFFALISGLLNDAIVASLRLVFMVFFSAFVAQEVRKSDQWMFPVLVGGLAAIIVAIGHFTGLIPLFDFERSSAGLNGQGLEIGFTGLVSARGEYGILLLLVLLAAMSKLEGFWLKIVILAIAFSAVITVSRSTWFALGVAGTTLGIYRLTKSSSLTQRLQRISIVFSGSVVLAAAGAWIGGFAWVSDKYTMLVLMRERSINDRLDQYSWAFENLGVYFFGGGGEAARERFGYSVHNNFLSLSLSFGLIAGAIMLTIVIGLLIHSIRIILTTKSAQDFNTAFIVLAILLGMVIEISLYPKFQSVIMWTLIGISAGLLSRCHVAVAAKPLPFKRTF